MPWVRYLAVCAGDPKCCLIESATSSIITLCLIFGYWNIPFCHNMLKAAIANFTDDFFLPFHIKKKRCPGLVSAVMIKHHDKNLEEERIHLFLHFYITEHHWGKPKQDIKQEQRQEPWRKAAYWFDLHSLLSLFFSRTQDHLPRSGITHSRLSPPTSIINKKCRDPCKCYGQQRNHPCEVRRKSSSTWFS